MMIPPSLALIVYGVTVNESITQLFFAGVFPGLCLALMFMGYVAAYSVFSRNWAPVQDITMSFTEKLRNSRFLLPVVSARTAMSPRTAWH